MKTEDFDVNGSLLTGIVCYMVGSLKLNVPYVVRAVTKINLSGQLLKKEVETTIDVVMQAGFSVSMAFDSRNCVDQIFSC